MPRGPDRSSGGDGLARRRIPQQLRRCLSGPTGRRCSGAFRAASTEITERRVSRRPHPHSIARVSWRLPIVVSLPSLSADHHAHRAFHPGAGAGVFEWDEMVPRPVPQPGGIADLRWGNAARRRLCRRPARQRGRSTACPDVVYESGIERRRRHQSLTLLLIVYRRSRYSGCRAIHPEFRSVCISRPHPGLRGAHRPRRAGPGQGETARPAHQTGAAFVGRRVSSPYPDPSRPLPSRPHCLIRRPDASSALHLRQGAATVE